MFGAGNETRTRDPDLGKVMLYQLSYSRVLVPAFYMNQKMRQALDSKSFIYLVEVVFKCGQAARKYCTIDHRVSPAATSSSA